MQIPVRVQVVIVGVGRVDLLVGDRLVIECDSRKYHTDKGQYAEDRRRDRMLKTLGYEVVRLTYNDVVHRWDHVVHDILKLVHNRSHMWTSQSRRLNSAR